MISSRISFQEVARGLDNMTNLARGKASYERDGRGARESLSYLVIHTT